MTHSVSDLQYLDYDKVYGKLTKQPTSKTDIKLKLYEIYCPGEDMYKMEIPNPFNQKCIEMAVDRQFRGHYSSNDTKYLKKEEFLKKENWHY
jgi:hypothetical protein